MEDLNPITGRGLRDLCEKLDDDLNILIYNRYEDMLDDDPDLDKPILEETLSVCFSHKDRYKDKEQRRVEKALNNYFPNYIYSDFTEVEDIGAGDSAYEFNIRYKGN